MKVPLLGLVSAVAASPYSLPFRARESKRRQSGGVPIDLRDLLAPAGRRCGCWPPAAFSV
jgi:hypothetical protein